MPPLERSESLAQMLVFGGIVVVVVVVVTVVAAVVVFLNFIKKSFFGSGVEVASAV